MFGKTTCMAEWHDMLGMEGCIPSFLWMKPFRSLTGGRRTSGEPRMFMCIPGHPVSVWPQISLARLGGQRVGRQWPLLGEPSGLMKLCIWYFLFTRTNSLEDGHTVIHLGCSRSSDMALQPYWTWTYSSCPIFFGVVTGYEHTVYSILSILDIQCSLVRYRLGSWLYEYLLFVSISIS